MSNNFLDMFQMMFWLRNSRLGLLYINFTHIKFAFLSFQDTTEGVHWKQNADGTFSLGTHFSNVVVSERWKAERRRMHDFMNEQPALYEEIRKDSVFQIGLHILKDSLLLFMKGEVRMRKYEATLKRLIEFYGPIFLASHEIEEVNTFISYCSRKHDKFSDISVEMTFPGWFKRLEERANEFQDPNDLTLVQLMRDIKEEEIAFLLRVWLVHHFFISGFLSLK